MFSYFTGNRCPYESAMEMFLTNNSDSPSQQFLHSIMSTFRGQHEEVKSQIAFAHLVKVIEALPSEFCWMRSLKELIIIDKLAEQNLFCEQICKLKLLSVEECPDVIGQNQQINAGRILKLFWKLIKGKGRLMKEYTHIICHRRSHRKSYISKILSVQVLSQIAQMQGIFTDIFDLIYYLQGRNCKEDKVLTDWKNSGLVEYLCVQLLYKLICLYSCQMLSIHTLTHKLNELSLIQIQKLKKFIIKFKQQCSKFIRFLLDHKNMKGFDHIHPEQIKNICNEDLIKFIDDYLAHKQFEIGHNRLHSLPFTLEKMKVQKKPMSGLQKSQFKPRLEESRKRQNAGDRLNDSPMKDGNPFNNWHNNFSNQFPQKQIMTVELILQIKQQQNLNKQSKNTEQIYYRPDQSYYRCSCNYDNRSTNVSSSYQINYKKQAVTEYRLQTKVPLSLNYNNIFSKCENKWN